MPAAVSESSGVTTLSWGGKSFTVMLTLIVCELLAQVTTVQVTVILVVYGEPSAARESAASVRLIAIEEGVEEPLVTFSHGTDGLTVVE
jgi:hypothetical protein